MGVSTGMQYSSPPPEMKYHLRTALASLRRRGWGAVPVHLGTREIPGGGAKMLENARGWGQIFQQIPRWSGKNGIFSKLNVIFLHVFGVYRVLKFFESPRRVHRGNFFFQILWARHILSIFCAFSSCLKLYLYFDTNLNKERIYAIFLYTYILY